MGMNVRQQVPGPSAFGRDPELVVDRSKRTFLRAAGLLAAGMIFPRAHADENAIATARTSSSEMPASRLHTVATPRFIQDI